MSIVESVVELRIADLRVTGYLLDTHFILGFLWHQ